MGQYHQPFNAAKREFLYTHSLDGGLKMVEILFSRYRVNAALAGLISVNPGNGPADLANSWGVGRWAGDRLFMLGDYAEEGDVPGWNGMDLNELWEAFDRELLLPLDETPRDPEAYYNIAPHLRGLIEQGCSVRFVSKMETWRMQDGNGNVSEHVHENVTLVPVKALAERHEDTGLPVFAFSDDVDERYREFLGRVGVAESDVDRPPQDGSWAALTNAEIDAGQHRVIASLDAKQYIDPTAFGDVPTTAGIMRGDSSAALTMSLFIPERRGGGDVPPDKCPSLGRWLNHRVIASSEYEGEFPTTDEIRASDEWTDVSQEMIRDLAAADY